MVRASLKTKSLLLFGCFFLVYLGIAVYLVAKNFYTNESLFLMEKSWVAFHGPEPKLASIGMTHPSLPFILICLVSFKPFFLASKLVSSLLGALLCTMMFSMACHKGVTPLRAVLVSLLFFANPLIVYAAISGEGYVPLLIVYLGLTYTMIRAMTDYRDSYFFAAGMLLAIGYFASFEVLLFAAVFLPYIVLGLKRNGTNTFTYKGLSYLAVLYFPLLYGLLIWILLNWLIVRDPLFFLRSPYSLSSTISLNLLKFPDLLELKGHLLPSLIFILKGVVISFPVYFIFLLGIERKHLFFYLAPIIIYTLEVYFGLTLIDFKKFSLFVLITVQSLFLSQKLFERVLQGSKILLCGAVLCLFVGNFVSLYGMNHFAHGTFYQREWLRTLRGHDLTIWNRQIEIGAYLKENVKRDELILLDDKLGYPIVVFSQRMKNFITPTHRFFNHYLANPLRYVDYVLVPSPWEPDGKLDLLNREYPNLYVGTQPEFTLLKDFGTWRLFRINKSPESEVQSLESSLQSQDSGL